MIKSIYVPFSDNLCMDVNGHLFLIFLYSIHVKSFHFTKTKNTNNKMLCRIRASRDLPGVVELCSLSTRCL